MKEFNVLKKEYTRHIKELTNKYKMNEELKMIVVPKISFSNTCHKRLAYYKCGAKF